MEDSMSSYVNSALYSKEASATSSEESGWTMYIEDFLASEEKRRAAAAAERERRRSGGGRKEADQVEEEEVWGNLEEDPLEDTASSPVNSPKVSGLTHPDLNTMKKDENREISKEVVAAGYGNDSVLGREVVSQLGLVDRATFEAIQIPWTRNPSNRKSLYPNILT
uniref:Uncharacterized protein n=1 Tax=Ananas comosus var. bracteatus TaxID=296719 RepID=A0A6V7QD19_ANACO|nr:unnamed protein product [Ananas comosus var. bracteatus]